MELSFAQLCQPPLLNAINVHFDSSLVFNESLDPGSVNSQTVIVQDGGQNPPVTLSGRLAETMREWPPSKSAIAVRR